MELKIVSFKIAKAIKEAGYDVICDYGYCVTDGIPCLVKTEEEWERHAINNSDMQDFLACTCQQVEGKDDCTAPTYLEVWLWLWREKNIRFDVEDLWNANLSYTERGCACNTNQLGGICTPKVSDPEEAIIAAIEYLVTNNLIK